MGGPTPLTTDPTDPRLGRLDPDGWPAAWLVLPEARRARLVRPLRGRVLHARCRAYTHLPQEVAESLAADPRYLDRLWCGLCGEEAAASTFRWVEDDGSEGPLVGG